MFDPLFSRILVAFDGSEPSKRALDYAQKMAVMFKGELIILTVVPKISIPIFPSEGSGSTPYMDLTKYQEEVGELYKRSLEKAEASVKERCPSLKVQALLRDGRPSSTIVEESNKNAVNLIVMGSRGLGGIRGMILGSTSRKVVDECTKPILIVK